MLVAIDTKSAGYHAEKDRDVVGDLKKWRRRTWISVQYAIERSQQRQPKTEVDEILALWLRAHEICALVMIWGFRVLMRLDFDMEQAHILGRRLQSWAVIHEATPDSLVLNL